MKKHSEIPKIIISMSTIPSRISRLPLVIDSIISQSYPVSEIRLYLPRNYDRFPGTFCTDVEIDSRVVVVWVEKDLGPLTKIAYAVDDLKGENALVLACDDDMIYEIDWVEKFVAAFRVRPNVCLAQSGGFLPQFSPGAKPACRSPRAKFKGFFYRIRRLVSLGNWKPRTPFVYSGFVDICEGWAGLLVRPEWFNLDFKDIPDDIKLVDDIWISAYLTSRGIDIWLIANSLRPVTSAVATTDALNGIEDPLYERKALNDKAVISLRAYFDIW